MTDAEKLLCIGNFMFNEGVQLQEHYRVLMVRRFVWYRDCDQLDMLDVIQTMDRVEYYNELNTMIGNFIHGRHDVRPRHTILTGLRDGAIL